MPSELDAQPALRTYLTIIRLQRWWLACACALGLGVGVFLSLTMPKQYSATAQVLVQPPSGWVTMLVGQQPITATDVQTELQLVTSAPVRARVSRSLGAITDVSASEVAQTNVIAITAISDSPARSARIANTYARAFVAYQRIVTISNVSAAERQLRSQISSIGHQLKSLRASRSTQAQSETSALLDQQAVLREQLAQMQVTGAVAGGGGVELVTPAQSPASPSSPGPAEYLALGLITGLLAGLAIAFLRNNLNDALTSKETAEQLGGAPVLAMVPMVTSWKKRDRPLLISSADPTSPAAEAYRSLRTSLQFARHDRDLRSLVVTSPAAAEGKSSTLANLGTVFAQAGERVVLVSCDLRRPRIGQFFGITEDSGLTTVLLGQMSIDDAVHQVGDNKNLWVLGAGRLPHNPAELLNGPAARAMFAALRDRFDLVLIDSPPVLPVTDAVVLSTIADATLLVAAAGQTTRGDLRRAAEKLAQVDAPVVGIVLNEVTRDAGYAYAYGYGYRSAYKPHAPGAAGPANGVPKNSRKVTAPISPGKSNEPVNGAARPL